MQRSYAHLLFVEMSCHLKRQMFAHIIRIHYIIICIRYIMCEEFYCICNFHFSLFVSFKKDARCKDK